MDNGVPSHAALRRPAEHIGLSAVTVVVLAAMPKCPLCWMALMSALGVSSIINSQWLQPLAITLLLLSVGALFVRARSRHGYGPFCLGLVAAVAMYLCKFRLDSEIGVYLGGATLLGASIWNALPKRQAADKIHCHC